MAQLGMAVGGAVLGSATGISGGAGYGFLAGSLLGAWLFPGPGQSQPKLEDEQVRLNVYGSPRAIGYGTVRMAGQPIWGTGRIATQHTEGGKGGPKYSYYTYSSKFCVHFADRVAVTYLRVWINGALVYDATGTDDAPNAVVNNTDVELTFYDGTQTTADPTMESYLGAGNVPAYKGQTMMVVDIANLEPYGNVGFPAVEAEIAFAGAAVYPWETVLQSDVRFPDYWSVLYNSKNNSIYVLNGSRMVRLDGTTYEVLVDKNPVDVIGYAIPGPNTVRMKMDEQGHIWVQPRNLNSHILYELDENLNLVGQIGSGFHIWWLSGWRAIQNNSELAFLEVDNEKIGVAVGFMGNIVVFSRENADFDYPERYQYYWGANLSGWSAVGASQSNLAVDHESRVWFASNKTNKLYQLTIVLQANPNFDEYPGTGKIAKLLVWSREFTSTIPNIGNLIFNEVDNTLLCLPTSGSTLIAKYDIESDAFIYTFVDAGNSNTIWDRQNVNLGVQSGSILLGSAHRMLRVRVSDLTTIGGPYDFANFTGTVLNGWVWDEPSNSIFIVEETDKAVYRFYLDRVAAAAEDLADVVSDLSRRSGRLVAGDLDVTDLVGNDVRGYLLARQVNAANAIRTLQPGYFFDGAESDYKLKFLMRPQSSGFAIPEKHLGEGEGAQLTEIYGTEDALPETVTVTVSNYDQAYNPVSVPAQRVRDAVSTRQRMDMQVPVVFTPSEAKQIAEKILFSAWTERIGHETRLPPRYLTLDPVDVGTITLGSQVFTVRATEISYGANRALALQAVQQDEATYTSTVPGYGGDGTGWDPSITIPDFTKLFILDIPYLMDAHATNDSSVPLYMGFAALGSDWDGAFLFKSDDTYVADQILTALQQITWGVATTKLHSATRADGSRWWATLDRLGSVTVRLNQGSLASVTRTQMLNGANAAALKSGDGWEIFQFQTVTDLGDSVYRLDGGLLRGRRGTNPWVDGHAVGDTFILLDTSTIKKYNAPNSDIDSLRYYKAMTLGGVFEDVDWEDFTLQANAYHPYSPAYIKGSRDGSNNLTITWKRRTRVGGEWLDGSGTVPVAEESEAYEVDILDSSGDVVRTIDSLTTPTATYTAAQQTTDFGSTQGAMRVAVYQRNATIGRGYAGEAVV